MYHLKRSAAALLVLILLVEPLSTMQIAHAVDAPQVGEAQAPVVAATPPVDWAVTDWDTAVTLPQDIEAFQKQVDTLAAQQKFDAIKKLKRPVKKLKDKAVMEYFKVPKPVQEVVAEHTVVGNKPIKDKELLRQKIQSLGFSLGGEVFQPLNLQDPSTRIDMRAPINIGNRRKTPYESPAEKARLDRVVNPPVQAPEAQAANGSFNFKLQDPDEIQNALEQKSLFDKIKFKLIPPAGAQAGAPPLMAYYAGIEKNYLDFALYSIAGLQNGDGSFGKSNQLIVTSRIVENLARWGRSNTDAFAPAVTFMSNYVPKTNEEKAVKIRVLASLGRDYNALLNELLAAKNQDGGFGFKKGYTSDVQTTLEVLQTLSVIQYNQNDTLPRAIVFVLSKINNAGELRYVGDANPSYFLVNRALEVLYPYRNAEVVGDNNVRIQVRPKLDAMLAFLRSNYTEESGLTWSYDAIDVAMTARSFELYGTDVPLQTSLKKRLRTMQSGDGSFGNDLRSTIEAMRVLEEADLVIMAIGSQAQLQNRVAAQFSLTVRNKGYKRATGTDLYMFLDNTLFSTFLNLEAAGVVFAPNADTVLLFNVNDTTSFTGTANIKFYIEPDTEVSWADNWRAQDFNVNPPVNPLAALPTYFIATQYDSGGSRGINVRWPVKADANRTNYIILWREKGVAQWSGYYINNARNGAFLTGGFNEGATYEVTMGVVHSDNSFTYFNAPVDVRATSTPNNFVGSVPVYVTENEARLAGVQTQGYSVSGKTDTEGAITYLNVPNGSTAARMAEVQYDELWTSGLRAPVGGSGQLARVFAHLKDDAVAPVMTSLSSRASMVLNNQYEERIQMNGTDNVTIKEFDIYYYDPNSQAWMFITTSKAQGNSLSYNWFVPESLLGDGYRLRALARDYRGNESAFREWGPFRVVNGRPPEFTVTSPNGGESWPLGSQQTIRWTTNAANGVANVNLYAVYPNGRTEGLVYNIGNTGQYNWQLQSNGYYGGTGVKIRVQGNDSVNRQSGQDESDSGFTIADNSPLPQSPWGTPEVISDVSTMNPAGGSIMATLTRFDTTGTLHQVMRYNADQMGTPRVITDQLIYRKKQNGVWSQPQVVYQNRLETDGNLAGYVNLTELKMELDANGNPHVLWLTNPNANGCSGMNGAEVWYMSLSGGQWSVPRNISNNNTASRLPDFALDAQGNVYVTWMDGLTWAEDCSRVGTNALSFAKRTNGNWQAAAQIAGLGNPYFPAIAVTADGKIHIVYHDGSSAAYRHTYFANGAWSAPVQVAATDSQPSPDLRAWQNKLHFVHTRWAPNVFNQSVYKIFYSSYENGQWSASSEVSPVVQNYYAQIPKVASDAQGNPHVMFEFQNLVGGRVDYVWTTRIGNQWLYPRAANRASQYVSNGYNDFDSDGNNQLAASWLSGYRLSSEVHFNTANLANDYAPPAPVSNLRLRSRVGAVGVMWDSYVNPGDAQVFRIYRSTLPQANLAAAQPIAEVQNLATTEYADRTAAPGTLYYYAVTVRDAAGNEFVNVPLVGPMYSRPAVARSLIIDGTMEAANTNAWRFWSAGANFRKSTDTSDSPNQSMYLNTLGGHKGFQQLNIPVVAGRRYRYSFSYRLLANANGTVPRMRSTLGIRDSNSDFERTPFLQNRINDNWQNYTREFTVPANFVSDFRAVLTIQNGVGYIDDVVIEEIPVGQPVVDSTMESATMGPWVRYSTPLVLEKTLAQFKAGLQSIHIVSAANTGVQQVNVQLRPGVRYKFSAWYKVTGGTLIPRLGTNSSNVDFEFPVNDPREPLLGSTNGEWRLYERTFTVPANYFGAFRIVFMLSNADYGPPYRNLPQGEAWVDEVTIVEAP